MSSQPTESKKIIVRGETILISLITRILITFQKLTIRELLFVYFSQSRHRQNNINTCTI